ncbi:MAG: hypothetical protein R3264_10640 [Anaerolineae bacterium]|nr:hypothetical protein [Anaerolineae bacterium]
MTHYHSLAGNWQFRQIDSDEWLPAMVPGGVHTDLLAVERIPDPFVADNEKRVQGIAETDWVYRRTFTVSAGLLAHQRIFLVCDGLDTLAEIRLNGEVLGQTDNMFRQYHWEVKSRLSEGDNELIITFRSPLQYVAPRQAERPLSGVSHAIPGGPYLRKAPCQFGWDWGPKLLPIGIWQDIRLEGRSLAKFDDVHLRQHHRDGSVGLEAAVSLERWQAGPLTATIQVTEPDGAVVNREASIADDTQTLQVTIENPRLWWPNGYGDQPLYQVELTLRDAESIYDRRTYQIGLRTLELRQTEDDWGKSFTFVINGVPIFAKGANWIPADSFPTRLTDQHLENLIRDAAATHQNMLRVWGGGFYEEERFYDLCDKYGILVWQDFIFSCSIYPMDQESFIENVRQEAVENIRRLRHRASLALWCGNNEMEWGWAQISGGVRGPERKNAGVETGDSLAGSSPAGRRLGKSAGCLRAIFLYHAAGMGGSRRPGYSLLAQLTLIQHPFQRRQRAGTGRCALLGGVARGPTLYRLPGSVSPLYERVWLSIAAAAGHHPHLRRGGRL